MFNLIFKKINIDYFTVHDNNLLYYSNNSLYINSKVFTIENCNVLGGHIDFQGVINVITSDKVYWFLNSKKSLLFISNHFGGLLNIENNDLRLARTDELNYSFFSIKLNKFITVFKAKFDGSYPSAIKGNYVFIQNFPDSIIKSLSLLTGEYNWEISLENYGEIVTALGVVENTLWIWFTIDQLIGVDVNTGEVKSHLFPLQTILKDIVGYVLHKYFIEKEQSLYFFHRSYLIQVNLLDNTTHLLWGNQEYEIGLSAFTDDYIYFIGGKNQGVFKNGIGVFDRKTNQVIWETTFELDNYVVLKEIQYSNDKIYVLDTAGVLRIFEKEE